MVHCLILSKPLKNMLTSMFKVLVAFYFPQHFTLCTLRIAYWDNFVIAKLIYTIVPSMFLNFDAQAKSRCVKFLLLSASMLDYSILVTQASW